MKKEIDEVFEKIAGFKVTIGEVKVKGLIEVMLEYNDE